MATSRARDLERIRTRLLAWYDDARRDVPWRRTRDPYGVMVSEVMLQQTQASRVAERFPRFMARFPTAEALAAASGGEVLAEWSGLGYNRRALALQGAAAAVARDGWPRDVAGLERLPGVGPYTARAIASLAFGLPVGVVDTNVRRWLVRRLDAPDRPRALQAVADDLAATGDDGRADAWTHATMEFGALVCRARQPRCDACPIRAGCPSAGTTRQVPVQRQPALHGSDRAYRGALVRWLGSEGGHRAPTATLRERLAAAADGVGPVLDDAGWDRVVSGLERDGLVHRLGDELRLGAATIGP